MIKEVQLNTIHIISLRLHPSLSFLDGDILSSALRMVKHHILDEYGLKIGHIYIDFKSKLEPYDFQICLNHKVIYADTIALVEGNANQDAFVNSAVEQLASNFGKVIHRYKGNCVNDTQLNSFLNRLLKKDVVLGERILHYIPFEVTKKYLKFVLENDGNLNEIMTIGRQLLRPEVRKLFSR